MSKIKHDREDDDDEEEHHQKKNKNLGTFLTDDKHEADETPEE
jgi:hypothetical protein